MASFKHPETDRIRAFVRDLLDVERGQANGASTAFFMDNRPMTLIRERVTGPLKYEQVNIFSFKAERRGQ